MANTAVRGPAQRTLDACSTLYPEEAREDDGDLGAVLQAALAGLLTAAEWETQIELALGEPLTRGLSERVKPDASLILP